MKNILCCTISNNQISNSDNVESRIYKCGGNTGNLVWSESIAHTICFDEIFHINEIQSTYDDVNYILPMSTQINVNHCNLERYANILLKSNCRVTMLGLGAQLTEDLNTPKKLVAALPDERKKALKELSLHTKLIGLRGYITSECLDLLGIHNHQVIGCPSFYYHGHTPPNIPKASSDKICFNWGAANSQKEQYLKNLLRKNSKEGYALIMQTMGEFPKVLYENATLLEKHSKSAFPDIDISPTELFSYIKKTGHIFFDINKWYKFLHSNTFTMSTGCRFHGNMLAFLSGIPTLWITHDNRTEELTEVLKLPAISIDKTINLNDPSQLCEYCNYDKKFYDNYKAMFFKYIEFLKANDITYRN